MFWQARNEEGCGQTPPEVGGPKATLIVCPLSVMSVWQAQVERHTRGNMEIYTYHGGDRVRSAAFLGKHDIVLTTYATLASELGARSGLLQVGF